MSQQRTTSFARGFNLIEAAIVLGIVGLVIGGIWVAASAVQSNVRKNDASRALIQIVQNVRAMYTGQPAPASATGINSLAIEAKAIPADFVKGTAILNPWNGQVNIALVQSGSEVDSIEVQYASMPRDVCIELTSRNTSLSADLGLTRLTVVNGSSTVTVTTFPFTPAQASTTCLENNIVMWRFGLRG